MAIEHLESAYLLHTRPYRNTSILATLFTQGQGRIDAVIRGARGKKSRSKGLLQVFTPLLIGWRERAVSHSDLITVKTVEAKGSLVNLSPASLACGFYINELLARLLHGREEAIHLFQQYETLLLELRSTAIKEALLRKFEKTLLAQLGYGLQLAKDAKTNEVIMPDRWYQFIPDRGPILIASTLKKPSTAFLGASYLALANNEYDEPGKLKDAKHIMRLALSHWLGEKPLKSRELFIK